MTNNDIAARLDGYDTVVRWFGAWPSFHDLDVEAVIDQTDEKAIRLTLGPCYGLAGRIDARRVRVELVPGESSDGV